jgi:hypothetical protein
MERPPEAPNFQTSLKALGTASGKPKLTECRRASDPVRYEFDAFAIGIICGVN